MHRFMFLLPAAALLPYSCISVNTSAQTLDAATVYRNWQADTPTEAWLKNGCVYVKVRQCDQRKDTPVIGSPSSQVGDGSSMVDIPGTEEMVFLKFREKDVKNFPRDCIDYGTADFTITRQFSPKGARKFHIPLTRLSTPGTSPPPLNIQQTVLKPSTGRKALAGVQAILIDCPGTVVANVLAIPVGLAVSPFLGAYNLFTRNAGT